MSVLSDLSQEKVAIVTGSNKGIGFAIVKNLCQQFNGVVYLTARNVARGEQAVLELNKLGLKPHFHQLDITDYQSITNFADFIKKTHGGIDVLVNNAAIARHPNPEAQLGIEAEEVLQTNFFSLIKICTELFPLLRPHARVVNISSSAGFLQEIPGDDLKKKLADPELTVPELCGIMNDFIKHTKAGTHIDAGWPKHNIVCYFVSKVGVSALTRIQHRQFLEDPREDIIINHVHPGYVVTDMTKQTGFLTTEQGADAPTYLALLAKGTTSPSGDYIWHDRQIVDWINGPRPAKY